jgi:hypothetical protein
MKIIRLSEAEVHYMVTLHPISLRKYLDIKYGIEANDDMEFRVEEKIWKIQAKELSSNINLISEELLEKGK